MLFFKFQKPGNLEFNMLRRGEIFFASVAELNDANECRPRFVLNGTKELWTRLAGYILQEACLRSQVYGRIRPEEIRDLIGLCRPLGTRLKRRVRNQDVGLEALDILFRELLEHELTNSPHLSQARLILDFSRRVIQRDLLKEIEEHTYIASFSLNARNPTMWGHYAAAERGFVIVYATSDDTIGIASPIEMLHGTRPLPDDQLGDFELGIYRDDQLKLKPVTYSKRPPKVNAFHRLIPRFTYSEEEDHYDVPLLLGGDAKDKEEDQVGLVKFSDWRYEQEIRAFLPFFGRLLLPPDVRVMRVAPEYIRGIIFGPQMSEDDKIRAVLCCHLMRASSADAESLPAFAFFQSSQVVDRFDFKIAPIGVLGGIFCDRHLPIKSIDSLDEMARQSLRDICQQIENGSQSTSVEAPSQAPK